MTFVRVQTFPKLQSGQNALALLTYFTPAQLYFLAFSSFVFQAFVYSTTHL